MDSRGWIPIPLLASFNRVKQLTQDVQLVREVLALSLVVEVRDDHVRLGSGVWEQFVLPDAPSSSVEPDPDDGEADAEDEDEDDEIEFVMVMSS